MAAWLTVEDLRNFAGNQSVSDDVALQLAVDVAIGKVEELCGPVAFTPITGEVVEVGGSDRFTLTYPPSTLTSITPDGGSVLTLADWAIDGQVVRRRSGVPIWATLIVAYTAGYYDATAPGATAPAWARSAGVMIAQQHMRTARRFGQTSDGPVGFLVPSAAMEAMDDHLLAADGFG